MLESEASNHNELVRRWEEGNENAADELHVLCLPVLSRKVGEQVAGEWFAEVRAHKPSGVGFKPPYKRCFLKWALERVSLYSKDPYRPLVEAFYAGDEDAYTQLYLRTEGKLRRILGKKYLRALGEDGIEAVVADFFFGKFFQDGARKYVPAGAPFLNWARRVVRNMAEGERRRLERLRTESLDDQPHDPHDQSPESSPEARIFDEGLMPWIRQALTQEQWDVLVEFWLDPKMKQKELARRLGYTETKLTNMLDEIRPRVARQMHAGGYREALAQLLYNTRHSNGNEGLLRRMFLRYSADLLVSTLREDPRWAAALSGQLIGLSKDDLWRMNARNDRKAHEVAAKIVAFYRQVSSVDPRHEFCALVREQAREKWGPPLADLLDAPASLVAPPLPAYGSWAGKES